MNETMTTNSPTETIHTALRILTGQCDFAQKPDGVGFNAFDTLFGHQLADQPTLTPGQAKAALKMLYKYSKQLSSCGIELPDDFDYDNSPTATARNGRIYLNFPGKPDADTRTWMKSINGWHWEANLQGMPWSFPHTTQVKQAIFEKFGVNGIPDPETIARDTSQASPVQQPQANRPEVAITLDKAIVVSFPAFRRENVDKIKSLPERKYDPDKKVWIVPTRLASKLVEIFPNAQGIEQLHELAQHKKELSEMSTKASGATTELKGLTGKLYPFQQVGVEFIETAIGNKDIFLCPLRDIIDVKGYRENTKRNLPTNSKPTQAIEDQSCKGENKRSQGESNRNPEGDCTERRMAGEGIKSNKESNAQAGCEREALEGTGRVPGKQRAELQGRQWSGRNTSNCKIECPVIARRMEKGVSSKNEWTYYETQCSDILQGGFCSTEKESSSGSGRKLSQQEKPENSGQKETGSTRKPWMDCPALETPVKGHGVLIADEPGLGKTIQAIGYLAQHPELRPAVIVVPASLKINWRNEIHKWLSKPERVAVISGTKTYDLVVTGASIVIINYDILSKWQDQIIAWKPAVVISDESHYCKNPKAARSKAMKAITKAVSKVILLTGTPVTNRPAELWPLLNMLNPRDWSSFWRFAERYCNAYHNGFGWDFSGASNLEELHEITRPYIIRRRKDQVLTELPPKVWSNLVIEFDEKISKEYAEAVAQAEREVSKLGSAQQLAMIEKMKQIAVKAKLPGIIDWIKDFVETGEKLLVFATHKSTIKALEEAFPGIHVTITGDTAQNKRQDIVDQFQKDSNIRLFFGNIQAAGVGLTLTAASNVLFVEYAWQPGEMMQASDRAHRIGQKDSVTIYQAIAEGTIDEDITALLEQKRQIVDTIHDGQVGDNVKFGILDELVKRILSREG